MSVLVTGASGFIGTAVVEALLAGGEGQLRCLVRPNSNRTRLHSLQAKYPEAHLELVVGNLARRADAERAIDGATTVYHLAAGMRGTAADMVLNTVVTSRNLLDAALQSRPARLVLVSSFAVYGTADLPAGHVISETTPIEQHPERRDPYSFAKHRQERLFWDYRRDHDLGLIVLRPGVVYGPGGPALSSRIGLRLPGLFLQLGGNNPLPLSFVDNCADAIVLAGRAAPLGEVYNVHDDALPSCAEFLRRYTREVENLRRLPIPYAALQLLSRLSQRYHAYSYGQMPAVFTPYRTATTWKRTGFDNRKLKALGWRQRVSTDEGIRRTFQWLRAQRVAGPAAEAT